MPRFMRLLSVPFAALLLSAVSAVGLAAPAGASSTHVVHPGQSIQAAINAASPGDTIIVRPGEYHENLEIATDRIKLIGIGATLEPAAVRTENACTDPSDPTTNGICIHGSQDPQTGLVTPVHGVVVAGFKVRDFSAIGILVFGGAGTWLVGNVADENAEYGIFAVESTRTVFLFNTVHGSGEAGIYVGDSPDAEAAVIANNSYDNQFGVFVRNAEHGVIAANSLHDNCAGSLFLADAPGPAGNFTAVANRVVDNGKFCAGSGDTPVDISGDGFLLVGAHGVDIHDNIVLKNVPSQPVPFSGGVVVLQEPGGTAPSNNHVTRNVVLKNKAFDLNWDGSGSGNVFNHNLCLTSTPPGLCH